MVAAEDWTTGLLACAGGKLAARRERAERLHVAKSQAACQRGGNSPLKARSAASWRRLECAACLSVAPWAQSRSVEPSGGVIESNNGHAGSAAPVPVRSSARACPRRGCEAGHVDLCLLAAGNPCTYSFASPWLGSKKREMRIRAGPLILFVGRACRRSMPG